MSGRVMKLPALGHCAGRSAVAIVVRSVSAFSKDKYGNGYNDTLFKITDSVPPAVP